MAGEAVDTEHKPCEIPALLREGWAPMLGGTSEGPRWNPGPLHLSMALARREPNPVSEELASCPVGR